MGVGARRGHPAARGALQESLLEQEWLVGVLHGLRLLTDSDGQGRQADRAAAELLDDRSQDEAVDLVETRVVDFEDCKRRDRRFPRRRRHRRGRRRSHAPGAAVGWRCAAYPGCDDAMAAAPSGDLNIEDAGRPRHDRQQVAAFVVVEPCHVSETIPQRWRHPADPGGGSDQGERREIESRISALPGPCRPRCRVGSPPWPDRALLRPGVAAGGPRR